MSDPFKTLARLGLIPDTPLSDLVWFINYFHFTKHSTAVRDWKNVNYALYHLRSIIMAKQGKKPAQRSFRQTETHWASLDLRSKEQQEKAMKFMVDSNEVLTAIINVLLEGGTITGKPDTDDGFVGFIFYPIQHEKVDNIGIRSSSKDPFKMLGALTYKFQVMLPDYELPDESEEEFDFR